MAVTFAINGTFHTTTNVTPGQLVFGRDMILHATHVADWECMRLQKQRKIDYNNLQENKSQIAHKHKIGDKAYLLKNVLVSKNALD